jgi:hypothetical protein
MPVEYGGAQNAVSNLPLRGASFRRPAIQPLRALKQEGPQCPATLRQCVAAGLGTMRLVRVGEPTQFRQIDDRPAGGLLLLGVRQNRCAAAGQGQAENQDREERQDQE